MEVAKIANLLERYCWTVDHKDWNAWLQCFATDGEFWVRGEKLAGRDAIREYVESSVGDYRLLRHLSFHPSIEVLDETSATSRCYFMLRGITASGTPVEALGAYEDRLTRQDDEWRFAVRAAHFDFYSRVGDSWDKGGDA